MQTAPVAEHALQSVAERRGQTLAQLAIAWTIRPRPDGQVASAIIGASSVGQLTENLAAGEGPPLTDDELAEIDRICG